MLVESFSSLTCNQEEEAGRELEPIAHRVDVELGSRHPFAVVAVDAIDEQSQEHR